MLKKPTNNYKKCASCYHSFPSDKYLSEQSPERCPGLQSMQRRAPNPALHHRMSVLLITQQGVTPLPPTALCCCHFTRPVFLICTWTRWFQSEHFSAEQVQGFQDSSYNCTRTNSEGVLVQGTGWLMFSSIALAQSDWYSSLHVWTGFTLQKFNLLNFDVK